MLEDRLLVWRYKRGSRDALCRIYEKYKNNLLALAVSLSNDISLGEDIVHDVFVSFAQAAARLELRGNLKSYLSTCVANRAGKMNRAESLHAIEQSDADAPCRQSNRPDVLAMSDEAICLIGDALALLPYEQREVILLHVHSGMTFREIARLRKMSINTVQSRYRYGLKKLKSELNSEV